MDNITRVRQGWGENVRRALAASDEEVGPACMNVEVPNTIDMTEPFREAYVQGYRHALTDVREVLHKAQ